VIKKILLVSLFISTISLSEENIINKQAYLDNIYKKIYSELKLWKAKAGSSCEIEITQDRQGNILNSVVNKCTTNDKYFIKQLKRAIKKSSPLPKAPKGLFSEKIIVNPIIKNHIDIMFSLRQRARKGDARSTRALNLLQGFEVDKKSFSTQLREMYKNNDSTAEKIYNNIGKSFNVKLK